MGWGSGVESRTTKSVGGGTAAGSSTARRGTAHHCPSSTGALVVWEFGWGRAMGSRLDGSMAGTRKQVGGRTAVGSSTGAGTQLPHPSSMHSAVSPPSRWNIVGTRTGAGGQVLQVRAARAPSSRAGRGRPGTPGAGGCSLVYASLGTGTMPSRGRGRRPRDA